MSALPPDPNLEQLRHQAKDLLRAAKSGTATLEIHTLSHAQLAVARDYGFASWPRLKSEVERRAILDSRDPVRLAALIAAGASVQGRPGDRETPLITAASYGDAEVAVVLIEAGASLEALSAPDAGGVASASALTHAAVFGNTDIVDLLVAAGAKVDSVVIGAAAGDITGWPLEGASEPHRLLALIMAADH